jgi:hypothetical protein
MTALDTRTCLNCGTTDDREGDGTPHASVSVVWSSRSRYWAVTVERCPLCGKRHHHGGGDGPEPALGHRVAHCVDHAGSYELIETPASRAARTLPHGCIGPACAVAVGPGQRSRCSGCGA